MQSPIHPVAPPNKKQRGNDGGSAVTRSSMNGTSNNRNASNGGGSVSSAADALTRRRMALDKLRRQQARAVSNPNDLLAKARSQLTGGDYANANTNTCADKPPSFSLNGNGPPPSPMGRQQQQQPQKQQKYQNHTNGKSNDHHPPSPSAAPPIPSRQQLLHRTSDIFPEVEKVQSSAPPIKIPHRPPVVMIPSFDESDTTTKKQSPVVSAPPMTKPPVSAPPVSAPPMSATDRSGLPPSSTRPPRAPSPSSFATVPPPVAATTPTEETAAIARRLDFATSKKKRAPTPTKKPPSPKTAVKDSPLPAAPPPPPPAVAVASVEQPMKPPTPTNGAANGPPPSSKPLPHVETQEPSTPTASKQVRSSPRPATNAPPTPPATGTSAPLSPTISLSPPIAAVLRNDTAPQRPPPITPTLETEIKQQKPPVHNEPQKSSRREFLSTMRQYADSPSTHKKKNSELELLKELKMVHRDKEDAFRQVVRLREQVSQLQTNDRKYQDFQALVQIAEQQGERAAVKWARDQVIPSSSSSLRSKSPFLQAHRPASPSRRALTPAIGPSVRKRVTTPHPRRKELQNGEETKLLAMATESNPDEFDSDVATYIVRRPYAPYNEEFWKDGVGELSTSEYMQTASVGKPASLEICAKIKLDGSILVLSGRSNVRHKKTRANATWRCFEDVDDMDQPLGSVMFIDGQANEGEYWLDEIYEQAMSTRDTYCSSLLATATALKSNMLQQSQQLNFPITTAPSDAVSENGKPQGLLPVSKTETANSELKTPIAVQEPPAVIPPEVVVEPPMEPPPAEKFPAEQPLTEHPPVVTKQQPEVAEPKKEAPMEKSAGTSGPDSKNDDQTGIHEKKPVTAKKEKIPAALPDEDEGTSDVFSVMLGRIFLLVFFLVHSGLKVLWFIVSRIPLVAMAGIAWAFIWLYFADDGGAGEMGASVGYGYNRAGIQ